MSGPSLMIEPPTTDAVDSPAANLASPAANSTQTWSPSLDALESRDDEFAYRPLPTLVPVSVACVFLSVTAFMWDVFIAVPLVGAVLALIAWRKIARSNGDYSGGLLAATMTFVLPAIAIGAVAFHAYSFATELPPGYARVSFATDIADKGFVVADGQAALHPDVEKLDGTPVFVKGYMYPERQTAGLTSFVLCKDSGDCCFGGQPKQTDMIYVEMAPGRTINYRAGLVSVAGEFRAQPTMDPAGLNPVYKLNCEFFSPAKTSY
jgi:hypothetical protein